MNGFVDLHCHWVAGIDDGARTVDDSIAMLRALADIGFETVVATPHLRAGMFETESGLLREAYDATVRVLREHPTELPFGPLSSEHHCDDVVFTHLLEGRGLPYPPEGRCALVEFPNDRFPVRHRERLFRLRAAAKIRPVLAHPERYRPVWDDITVLDPLLDGGTVLLLDVAALVGKYGRAPKRAAHRLLEEGYYYAACSDAHRAKDARIVGKGIKRLEKLMGPEETRFLLREGPRAILAGTVED